MVSPFCHKFLEKYDGTALCVISFYMISVASFLSGPSWLCRSFMDDSLSYIISGLLVTGLFTSFTTIGTYNEMYLPFVELHGGEPDDKNIILYDKDKLGDILSGLYNGAYSMGVIIGPFSASYLMIWLDDSFRKMSDVFTIFIFIYATLLLIVVYIPNKSRKARAKRETKVEKKEVELTL